jgi:hypothetical protein
LNQRIITVTVPLNLCNEHAYTPITGLWLHFIPMIPDTHSSHETRSAADKVGDIRSVCSALACFGELLSPRVSIYPVTATLLLSFNSLSSELSTWVSSASQIPISHDSSAISAV